MKPVWPPEDRPCRFVTPRELSFHPFSFPFGDPARVRQALSLQLSSLLGGTATRPRLHPVILQRDKDHSKGFALVFPEALGPSGDPAVKTRLFPAPLALAGALGGHGLGVWADEENVACVLWREGVPVLYRCSPRTEGEPGEVIEWIRRSSETEIDVLLLDSRGNPEALEQLQAEARRTWAAFPALAALDLSSRQMESALRLESFSSILKPVLSALLVLGLLFDAAAGCALLSAKIRLSGYEEASIRLYRQVFDPTGPVLDPLSQAKARLAKAQGTDSANGLAGSLAMLGRAAESAGSGIVLDAIRFSERQAEISGKGPSVEAIRAFQQALDAGDSSLEDLQQLPGGFFRFKVTVRGDGR